MSSIRARVVESGGVTVVKALVRHPIESGNVKDANGNLIPAHYIKVIKVEHKGKPVFVGEWGPAVSKDPYLECKFKGAAKGEEITISWVDNKGETDTSTIKIG